MDTTGNMAASDAWDVRPTAPPGERDASAGCAEQGADGAEGAELRARIRARIRSFDATALLDLLEHLGYSRADIAFRAHESSSPQPSLLHDIEFAGDHGLGPRVTITVNVGLASCRSPLPSYFTGLLADMDIGEPLRELLDLLDHALIRDRLLGERPERGFGASWDQVRSDFVALAGLCSPSGVDWLFRHVFPELDVLVRRGAAAHAMPSGGVRIGVARLGGCAFGNRSLVPVRDLHVTLRCRESLSPAGVPWLHEAQARLRAQVFPALGASRVQLTVALLLCDDSMVAQLDVESPVGFAPLPGGAGTARHVEIFRGQVPAARDGLRPAEAGSDRGPDHR
jgi:hypothetical protein